MQYNYKLNGLSDPLKQKHFFCPVIETRNGNFRFLVFHEQNECHVS